MTALEQEEARQDYYRRWTEVDIYAPMTLLECRRCGALVTFGSGSDLHKAWHESGDDK